MLVSEMAVGPQVGDLRGNLVSESGSFLKRFVSIGFFIQDQYTLTTLEIGLLKKYDRECLLLFCTFFKKVEDRMKD